MIRNIIFDMGGVLLDLDRERCVEAFRDLGFPQADSMLDPYTQTGIFGALESGHATPSDLFNYVRRESGLPISDDEIASALNSFVVDLPLYKLEMLRDLTQTHTLYLLSNTNAIMMPYIQSRYFTQLPGLGFDDYFPPQRAFMSYRMGYIKPDPEIFRKMIREAGFLPQESLFIDDGPANIETAKTFGFNVYCPAPQEDFRPLIGSLLSGSGS